MYQPRFRRMRHFTIPEFGVTGEHYKEKDNIEDMTYYILDRLWDAWELFCASQDLGSPILKIRKGWVAFDCHHPFDLFFKGCAVELDPDNGEVSLFQRFCRELFARGVYQFDEISPTDTGVKIIYKNAKKEQRKIVNLTEKL